MNCSTYFLNQILLLATQYYLPIEQQYCAPSLMYYVKLWCCILVEMAAEFDMHFGVIDPSHWATKPHPHSQNQWNTNFSKI